MPEPKPSLDDAYRELHGWTKALLFAVEQSLEHIQRCLDPKTELPVECPSRPLLALWVFRDVQTQLAAVKHQAALVVDAIQEPNARSSLALPNKTLTKAGMCRALNAIHETVVKLPKAELTAEIQDALDLITSLARYKDDIRAAGE
jgi:hypothetical protein